MNPADASVDLARQRNLIACDLGRPFGKSSKLHLVGAAAVGAAVVVVLEVQQSKSLRRGYLEAGRV